MKRTLLMMLICLFYSCDANKKKENENASESVTLVSVSGRELSREEEIIRANCFFDFSGGTLIPDRPRDELDKLIDSKAFTVVEEISRSKEYVVYLSIGLVLGFSDDPISYSSYFRVNDKYLFIQKKGGDKYVMSEEMQKKLRITMPYEISFETTPIFLKINLADYSYEVSHLPYN